MERSRFNLSLASSIFTLTQVILLLITSTFTRVQIQSNSGTLVIGVCTMWSSLLVVLVGDDDGDNHDDEGSKSGEIGDTGKDGV